MLLTTLAVASVVQAQVTNAADRQPAATNIPATNDVLLLPLVEFRDVPITAAIENLARQAGINYMIDPYRCQKLTGSEAEHIPEPDVTFRLENVTAKDVLERMLNVRNFALIEDPLTHIARIAPSDATVNFVDASLLGMDTNKPVSSTNDIIPLIQFQCVPLDFALANLIRQSAINIALDPRLIDSDDTWNFIKTNGLAVINYNTNQANEPREKWFNPMPVISIRWENLTANQTIVALCQNYDLVIVKDDTTGTVQIKPNESRKRHHLRHF